MSGIDKTSSFGFEIIMKKIVLASANTHKFKEFERIFKTQFPEIQLISLSEFSNIGEIEETGMTFAENALIKARKVSQITQMASLGDDSGLVVDALDGRPGIYSARYAGMGATDKKNVQKILNEIKDIDDELLTGKFVCALSYVDVKNKQEFVVEGQMLGKVVKEVKGENGFGYDPIFIPDGLVKTSAQLSDFEKDQISHRGAAAKKFSIIFQNLITL